MTRMKLLVAAAASVVLCACAVLQRVPDGVLMTVCELATPTGEGAQLSLVASVAGVLCEDADKTQVIVPADHGAAHEVARNLLLGEQFWVDGVPTDRAGTRADPARKRQLEGAEDPDASIVQVVTARAMAKHSRVGQLNRMDTPTSMKPKKSRRPWQFWRWFGG